MGRKPKLLLPHLQLELLLLPTISVRRSNSIRVVVRGRVCLLLYVRLYEHGQRPAITKTPACLVSIHTSTESVEEQTFVIDND